MRISDWSSDVCSSDLIVREEEPGLFIYLGRRDRMIKRRGFRVELGEIEAALNNHPDVVEAAVMAFSDPDGQVSVEAFLSWGSAEAASILQLKRYCNRSEEHTSELQSLMRISYAVFCLKNKTNTPPNNLSQ